jgi:glutaredoxin
MYNIYTQNQCNFCTMAKQIMFDQNIDFMEINVQYDDQAKDFMKEQGFKTVPQIYDNDGNHIGGYNDLLEII